MSKRFIYRILTALLLAACLQACSPHMDVSELERVYCYQAAGVGSGVDVVIMGDGFSRSEIQDGSYAQAMAEAAEAFLAVQPFKRYRNYFNVYVVEAVSEELGVSDLETTRNTRFGVRYTGSGKETGMKVVQEDLCFSYAQKAPVRLNRTLIIMVANSSRYGGTCHMWSSGRAIAICPLSREASPYDFAAIVRHEAGGHGFGKLADEYGSEGSINAEEREHVRKWQQQYGHYVNISLSSNPAALPWKDFIGRPGYEGVGAFEGGYTFAFGVWRSEEGSCMINNIPYFNAPSRLSIVKRIASLSGQAFSQAQFWIDDAADAQDFPIALPAFVPGQKGVYYPPLAPPVLRN